MKGQNVLIRARIQTSRAQGNKMCFLNLRQRTHTVQGLVSVSEGKISKQMVKWVAGLQDESIVLLQGSVTVPPEVITSATVGDVEIHIDQVCLLSIHMKGPFDLIVTQIHLISGLDARLPFSLDDASRAESELENTEAQFNKVLLDTRLNNRVFDLRVCRLSI